MPTRRRAPRPFRALYGCAVSLALFASLIWIVDPPLPDGGDGIPESRPEFVRAPEGGDADPVAGVRAEAEEAVDGGGGAETTAGGAPTVPVLVECIVSTPHSSSPSSSSASGKLRISVRPDLAPNASSSFLRLVEAKYYDGVYVFRALKGFIAQFGIHPGWNGTVKPEKSSPDPVLPGKKSLSNVRGTVSFAGGNTRTGQVFINLGNNARLDDEGKGTRPFAVIDPQSMELADKLYAGYKEGQGQVKAVNGGEEVVAEKFPDMRRIESCRVGKPFSP